VLQSKDPEIQEFVKNFLQVHHQNTFEFVVKATTDRVLIHHRNGVNSGLSLGFMRQGKNPYPALHMDAIDTETFKFASKDLYLSLVNAKSLEVNGNISHLSDQNIPDIEEKIQMNEAMRDNLKTLFKTQKKMTHGHPVIVGLLDRTSAVLNFMGGSKFRWWSPISAFSDRMPIILREFGETEHQLLEVSKHEYHQADRILVSRIETYRQWIQKLKKEQKNQKGS
jgi:hypothetical protein